MNSSMEPGPMDKQSSVLILQILKALCVFLMALLPPVFLFFYLEARGPLWLLISWILAVTGCELIVVQLRPHESETVKKHIRGGIRIFSLLLSISAVLLVLLQMNVARRSLAEAWFNLVRNGRAFGFFSFFASEILAVFSTQCAVLAMRKNLFSGISALAGILFLIYAILYALAWPALVSLVFLVTALLSASLYRETSAPGLLSFFRTLLERIKSIFFPFAAALLLSVPFAFIPQLANNEALLHFVDFSPLVFRVTPALPLLLDVPGYGYSVGASRFSPSVYLSDAVIFRAQAVPLRSYYLATQRYDAWTLSSWSEWNEKGTAVPVYRDETEDSSTVEPDVYIRLSLEAELFDSIPLPVDAVSVQLRGKAPDVSYADTNRGLRFSEAALRGLEALIGIKHGAGADLSIAFADVSESFLDPGSDPEGRIKTLADSLGSAADPELFIYKLGRYFMENYSYSLDTPAIGRANPLTQFLFEHKTGYCLHFASSAVLLARHAGIPARLVEGFVLRTDRYGQGLVRGVDSHAWMEYWADGKWQAAELTPPFIADDPFSFSRPGDGAAFRQLRAIFGIMEEDDSVHTNTGEGNRQLVFLVPGLSLIPCLLLLYIFRLRYLGDPYGQLKRRACRMVRKGRRKGIEGPEIQGWTRWAHEMEAFCTLEAEKGRAEALALLMLEAAFNPDVLSERKTIKMNRC